MPSDLCVFSLKLYQHHQENSAKKQMMIVILVQDSGTQLYRVSIKISHLASLNFGRVARNVYVVLHCHGRRWYLFCSLVSVDCFQCSGLELLTADFRISCFARRERIRHTSLFAPNPAQMYNL